MTWAVSQVSDAPPGATRNLVPGQDWRIIAAVAGDLAGSKIEVSVG